MAMRIRRIPVPRTRVNKELGVLRVLWIFLDAEHHSQPLHKLPVLSKTFVASSKDTARPPSPLHCGIAIAGCAGPEKSSRLEEVDQWATWCCPMRVCWTDGAGSRRGRR